MIRLDIFDLYEMFAAARSFALVGNAGTILTHENGALIDSHDVVVRFNCAYVAGIEAKVGSRTDILCAGIGKSTEECPSPALTLRPRCVLHFATKSPRDPGVLPARFREWVGDLPCVITLAPDLIGVSSELRTRQLTQGTYLLYTFLRLFTVERLFVTGFTMYAPVAGTPLKYFGAPKRQLGLQHDLATEAQIFCDILGSFDGELELTSEVEELLARHGRSRHVRRGRFARRNHEVAPTFQQRLRGRVAWELIRWGLKMRRSLEGSAGVDFQALKKSTKEDAAGGRG